MNAKLQHILDAVRSELLSIGGLILIVLIGGLRKRLFARAVGSLQVQENLTNNKEVQMEKVIVDSKELDIKFAVVDGKMKIYAEHEGALGGAKVELYGKLEAVIDALEAAIPGDWDKMPAAMLKQAVKSL